MKRVLMTLFIGLALAACSNTKTNTTDKNTTTQTPTTENETTQNSTTNNTQNNGTTTDAHVKYLEDLGYTNVKNVNGTTYQHRYTLNETVAEDKDIYGQWLYTWVEPADYLEKDIDVYQYTATKDNKDYDVYMMLDTDSNVIGGYYYEQGKTMDEAQILHETHKPRLVEDFEETWNRLFNINQTK